MPKNEAINEKLKWWEACFHILYVYCTPASSGHVSYLPLNSIQSSYWNPRSGIRIHKVWMDFRLNRIINTYRVAFLSLLLAWKVYLHFSSAECAQMHVSMKRLLAVKACRLSAFYVYAFKPIYLYWVYKLFSVFRSVHTALDVSFSWWKRELHSLEVLQYFLSGLNKSQKRATIWQLELIWVGRKYFFSSNAVRSLPQVEAVIWIWITVPSDHPSPELPFRSPVWWACLRWQSIHSAWAELCCLQNKVLYARHPSSLRCMERILKLFLRVQPVCWQKGYDIFR